MASLAPDEAVMIAGVLEMKRKAIETVDIERRLTGSAGALAANLAEIWGFSCHSAHG